MKAVAWIVGILVVAVLAGAAFLLLHSGNLIKHGIETLGPRYLDADVAVSTVELSLQEGSGEIRGLTIGNPAGFSGPYAFSLGQMKVVLEPSQISGDLVVIKELVIDAADIAVVAVGRSTNVERLLDNVKAATGAGADEPAGGESELKLIIDRFAFTNARVSLDSDILGERELTIADVKLKDIGRRANGASVGEALQQILTPLYQEISEQVVAQGLDLDQVRDDVEKNLRDKAADKLGSGLKGLTDRLKSDEK